jgi:hypothetical protein
MIFTGQKNSLIHNLEIINTYMLVLNGILVYSNYKLESVYAIINYLQDFKVKFRKMRTIRLE